MCIPNTKHLPNQAKFERREASAYELIFHSLQRTCIPFPPNDPHKTMRDHSPKHLSSDSIKLAWSTCYKFHNTMSTWPNEPQILYTPYSTTLELLGNVGLSGQWSPHSSCVCNTNPSQPLLSASVNYQFLKFSPNLCSNIWFPWEKNKVYGL